MSLGEGGMVAFQHTALPARVVFGFGAIAKASDEIELADNSDRERRSGIYGSEQ